MNRNIITNGVKIVEKCAMERKGQAVALVMFNHILLPDSPAERGVCVEREMEIVHVSK